MSQPNPSAFRVSPVVHDHGGIVYSVAFSPDGGSVASGSTDRTVRIWDAHSSSSNAIPLRGHSQAVYSVSYSPEGKLIASGSRDKDICIWDTSTGLRDGDPLRGHAGNVNSVAFSHSGKFIASGSSDNSVRLWDVQSRSPSNPLTGHYGRVNSVGFSPENAYIASGSDDTTIRVWDAESGTTILGPFQGHTHPVRSIAFSPNGSQLVSGSADSTVRLWDARNGKMIGKPYEGHTGTVTSVAFSPSGLFVASGSYDKTIRIWDIRNGDLLIDPIEGHTGYVYSVAFSPSSNRIVSSSNDGRVIVWSIPGSGLFTKHGPDTLAEGRDDPPKAASSDRVSRQMSMKDVFGLLLQHGCIDISSQMDPAQESNFVVNGGGFGDIWTGKLLNGTKVAIKVWRASSIEEHNDKSLKRAAREIYSWSRMKHRNIHELLGVIIFKDQHLGMISEWMENGNLREHMWKNPEFDRYEMCTSIASGLAYIHQSGTVHGDLKALNVLVSADGVAKLADFGLSTVSGVSLGFSDTSNPQLGSARWAAPELLSEETPRSKESDVYALGMTILEVISGEVPFPECHSDYQVIMKVTTKGAQPTRPTTQLKDNDRGNQMWSLLVRCWDRERSARPSAQEVLESLKSIRALTG